MSNVAEKPAAIAAPAPAPTKGQRCDRARIVQWLADNNLLISLIVAFAFGLAFPRVGQLVAAPVADLGPGGHIGAVKAANIAFQFLVSGFRMRADSVLASLRAPLPLATALLLMLVVTPCTGFGLARLPVQTREFAYGLAIFSCVPTTLTTGAAMIAGSGMQRGADLGLVIVVMGSLLGCFTVPVAAKLLLHVGGVSINQMQLFMQMLILVLAPTLLGKLICETVPGVKSGIWKHRQALGILSNANLSCVVWQAISDSQAEFVRRPLVEILVCIIASVSVHFVFWGVNLWVLWWPTGFDKEQRRAIFLLASQKSLPFCLAVIGGMPRAEFDPGLLALPCVLGHFAQLFVDAFLLASWVSQDRAAEARRGFCSEGAEQGTSDCGNMDAAMPGLIAEGYRPIITVAITGHRTTKEMAPGLPTTLQEQVEACAASVAKGASIVHLHVCEEDPTAVIPSLDATRYFNIIRAVRERLPGVILEITTRGEDRSALSRGGDLDEVVERGNLVLVDPAMWGHDDALRPEFIALNLSTRNVDRRTVTLNPLSRVEEQIRRIYELGCTPRCDVYDAGDVLTTARLLAAGVLRAPVHYLLIMGSFSGIGVERRDLEYLVSLLPPGSIWTALGTGRFNFPVAQYCLELGGHLRTGFEDTTYISKGVKAASNAQLVDKMASLCRAAGTRPATTQEARDLLGLQLARPCESMACVSTNV